MLIDEAILPNHHELIFACHITGVYDVNRQQTIPHDDYNVVKDWVNSLQSKNVHGILFHNGFSQKTLATFKNEQVQFIKVQYNADFNPNVFRYFVYQDYLKMHAASIKQLFITDVADVVVVNNPFNDPFFKKSHSTIFCGDEPKPLGNRWMLDHCAYLRTQIEDFASFERTYKDATLLNCGIIGGDFPTMSKLLTSLCHLHKTYNKRNKTAFTGDMGAFNYIMRTKFEQLLYHGTPCNTVFKAYETDRTDCWFRHK